MSDDLKDDLTELGLERSVSAIINAGYNNWSAIEDMTESDFDALDIRLGDRRKLQREIARRQMWPDGSPLPTHDELREHTLSLQDNDGEDNKNGIQQIVYEAEVMFPTNASTPAREVCLSNRLLEKWIFNNINQSSSHHTQGLDSGRGRGHDSPGSPDSIPVLELDDQMEGYGLYGAAAQTNPSSEDLDSDNEDLPRAGDRVGNPTARRPSPSSDIDGRW